MQPSLRADHWGSVAVDRPAPCRHRPMWRYPRAGLFPPAAPLTAAPLARGRRRPTSPRRPGAPYPKQARGAATDLRRSIRPRPRSPPRQAELFPPRESRQAIALARLCHCRPTWQRHWVSPSPPTAPTAPELADVRQAHAHPSPSGATPLGADFCDRGIAGGGRCTAGTLPAASNGVTPPAAPFSDMGTAASALRCAAAADTSTASTPTRVLPKFSFTSAMASRSVSPVSSFGAWPMLMGFRICMGEKP